MTFTLKIHGDPTGTREYLCDAHGRFDLVVDLATSRTPRPCPVCAAPCERTIEQNIVGKVGIGFFRGKSDPPPNKFALDTTKLGQGDETMSEFRAKRRALHRGERLERARAKGKI